MSRMPPQRRDGSPPDVPIRRAGGRGQRDPELASRIARGEPVMVPQEPDGVVVRQTQPDDQQDQYQQQVEPEQGYVDENEVGEFTPFLLEGDLIEAKVHHVIEL